MKNIFLLIISFFLFSQISFACMPFTPNQIVIGTFEGAEIKKHPNGESLNFINISNVKKPLAENYTKIGKYFFVALDNDRKFSFSDYKKGDSIIMIADYNNGNYENYFAVYEMGKLIRNSKEELEIIDLQGYIKDWGKSMWQCGNYKNGNAMGKKELLDKLAYYIDVGVPVDYGNIGISYYLLGGYFIDKFIQGKGEIYIGVGILLQILVIIIYIWIISGIIYFFRKRKK